MVIFDVVIFSYVAMLLFVLVVEFTRTLPVRRVAAVCAMASALVGGSTWCYAAYVYGGPPDDVFWQPAPRQMQEAIAGKVVERQHRGGARAQSVDDMIADAAHADARSARGTAYHFAEGDGVGRNAPQGITHAIVSEASAVTDKAARAVRRWVRTNAARWGLLRADQVGDTPGSNEDPRVTDCSHCPEMVIVPAGSATIVRQGVVASASTSVSASAEQGRVVSFWPGFAIGAKAVTASSFNTFLDETGRPLPDCPAAHQVLGQLAFARCVSPQDAEAYATWLTLKTGKSFRLPTADEWRYAAIMVKSSAYRNGDIAEITADCRDLYPNAECASRELVGGVPEGRSLQNSERAADIGFRLLRPEP